MPSARSSSIRLGCALLLALLVSILAPTLALAQQTYTPQPPVPAPVVHRGQTNVTLGDHYHAAGERIDLYRRADQLVVQLPPQANAQAVLADLIAPAGPLAGFGEVRDFGNGLKMLANPALSGSNVNPQNSFATLNAALARLERDPRVRFSVPVFVNARLGTYAVATDELLVRLRPGVQPEDFFADSRFARYEQAPASDAFLVQVAAGAGEPVLALAAALQGDARLLWAEPNFYQERQRYFVPNDTLFLDQWHLRNTGQGGGTPGADAKLVPAWDVATTPGQGIVIAIVDDGPELSHPDLAVYTNTGEIAGNGIDDDGNGFIDDVRGWDFTNNDNDGGPSLSTDQHGTSVAGVAAARGNNATGVTGAAYQATIFPARIFFGPTPTSDANIAAALAYASGRGRNPGDANWRGADIVNNSWGGGGPSTAINEALTWAATNGRGGLGTPHFFATGNSGASSISLPASLSGTIASVIAVGASNNIDVRSSYSQFGPQIDFVAPSNDQANGGTLAIWTTDRLGANGYNGLPDQNYTNQFGGTSSATPLAAGVGALLLALDPTLTVAQVRALMRATTDRIGPLAYDANGFNVQYGYGRINADRAVRALDRAAVAVNLGAAAVASGSPVVQSSLAGETRTLSFSVRSTGELDLTLGAVQLSGAGEFTVSQPLGSSTLALGQATTFEVSFSSAAAGTFNATASFTTNDPDAPTFSIPIQFDVSPVSIGGRVFEDRNGDGVIQPGETARVGETVYLDTDNSGTMNPPVETTIASAANLGLVISNAAPIASTLTPSGLGSELQGLEVRVTLTHTYVSDLRLVLQAPNGTSIELASGAGGSGDNMTNTVFADDATVAISAGTAPFTGRFRPNQPLSTFFNSNPNGIWTLRVFDSDPADNGTLVNWSLIVRHSGEPRRTSNALGDYAFVGLAPGSYRVRSAPGSGWSQVSPAGAHQVTVIGNESNIGRDFGLARQNSVYGKVYNDLDASGTFAAANDTVRAGATVFLDTNGNSTLDPPVPVTLTRSPALPIPGNSTVTDTLVSTTAGAIAGITVTLNITHTWVSDLTVRLTSPTGTVITLVAGRGGSGDNFTGTVFDDAAAVAISAGTAPFTGSFRPEQPLSELIGQAAAGNWQLTAVDRFTADSGTLVSWSLNLLVSEEPSQTSDSFGNFRFDGVSGSNSLRLIVPGGLQLSEPLAGNYPLSLGAGQFVQNRNFGLLDKAILVTPTAGLVTTEAGGTATFTVVLSSAPSADVVVGLSSSDTTEGTVSPTSLTFTPSNWSTPQTVTVTGVDDAIDDGDVGYSIVTAPAASADAEYSGMNPADVAVSNTDNDTAGITVSPTVGLVTTEAGGTASFTVVLTSEPTADVSLGVASNDASEGTAAPASLTFTAANWNVAQTVTVTGVDDAIDDGNIAYTIVTAAATSSDPIYAGLNPPDVAVSNIDNDIAGITVSPIAGLVTTEAGGTASFTVVLTSEPTANVTLGVASNDASEGTAAPASLTFTAANWNVAQTVTVTGVDDAIDDGNIAYSIVTAAATSSDPNYAGQNPPDVAVSNIDDDTAGIVVIESAGSTEVQEGGAGDSYTVVLASQPTADVSVNIAFDPAQLVVSGDTDGVFVLTFTAADWSQPQTVNVVAVDDTLVEANPHSTLIVQTVGSSDPVYAAINPADVAVSIAENDTVHIALLGSASSIGEAAGAASLTTRLEIISNGTPGGTLTSALSAQVVLTAGTAAQGTDYTPDTLVVTFPAGSAHNATQPVSVGIVNDRSLESAETFSVSLTPASGSGTAGGSHVVTIMDDETGTVGFLQASASVGEGAGSYTHAARLTISGSGDGTIFSIQDPASVVLTAVDGTAQSPADYGLQTAVLSVPANATSPLDMSLDVAIVDDGLVEANEDFTLAFGAVTGPAGLGTSGTHVVTITDNDSAVVSFNPTSLSQSEGAGPMLFTATLSNPVQSGVTLTVNTVPGTATAADFTPIVNGTLNFPAGSTAAQTVSVAIIDDPDFEPAESFGVTLSNLVASGNVTLGAASAIGTIEDNDQQPTMTMITGRTPSSTVVGQPYTVAVTVTAQTLSPTGSVTVSDGSASCSAPLTAVTAPASTMSCSLTSTTAGTKTLTASYTPDSTAFGASDGTTTHPVTAAATTISVSGPARSRINQPIAFSFALSVSSPGAGTPTGVVTLSSGSSSCTATLPATSCNLTFATLGSRTVTASYASDGNYAASTSSGLPTLVFALADVSITKSDGESTYQPGDLIVYTVQVRNAGPDAAAQVQVQDIVPAGLSSVTWTCDASGGAVCSPSSGVGDLDVTLANLPVGALWNYTFYGTVTGLPEQIVNTATLTLPADTTVEDPNPGNNSATDVSLLENLYANGFEASLVNGPEGSVRLPTAALAPLLDEVARIVFRLEDKRGEMARVYARLHLGAVEYALATRGPDGRWTMGAWSGYAVDPTLSWNAELTAGSWQLTRVELR